jgi:hypothetical protein
MNKKSNGKAISPISGGVIPTPGPGRPKGSHNKISHTAKENIEKVFDMLGGVSGLYKWAAKNDRNRAIFYQTLYAKILPMEHEHSGEVNVDGKLTVEFVETRG